MHCVMVLSYWIFFFTSHFLSNCRCLDLRDGLGEKDDGEEAPGDEVKGKDNRSLIDNNTAQTLSAEDISKMRTYEVTAPDSVEVVRTKYDLVLQ